MGRGQGAGKGSGGAERRGTCEGLGGTAGTRPLLQSSVMHAGTEARQRTRGVIKDDQLQIGVVLPLGLLNQRGQQLRLLDVGEDDGHKGCDVIRGTGSQRARSCGGGKQGQEGE